MKLEQEFSYTGSDVYELNNINVKDSGVSLFDTLTGIGS